jgi:hypothetical protein
MSGCSDGVTFISPGSQTRTASVTDLVGRYAELTGRTGLSAPNLPNDICPLPPDGLSSDEAVRQIKETLAKHNVSVIDVGEKFVKFLPTVTSCVNHENVFPGDKWRTAGTNERNSANVQQTSSGDVATRAR